MILISVIVPVYNAEQYIARCLDSIINQDYNNIEIIVIEDGSTDTSGLICDKYASVDMRIKVLHQDNSGVNRARKNALAYVKGNYISCIDPDDFVDNGFFSDAYEVINECCPDLICYPDYIDNEVVGIRSIMEDYLSEGLYTKHDIKERIVDSIEKEDFCCQVIDGSYCRKIISKDLFVKYQSAVPDDINNAEDQCVVLPVITHANSVYIRKKPYYHYVKHVGSITNPTQSVGRPYCEFISISKHFSELLKDENEWSKQWYVQRLYFIFCIYLHGAPDNYVENGLPFIPEIKRGSRVVIYGKGLFAKGMIKLNESNHFIEVVANVDSSDYLQVGLERMDYDFVLIAIFDYLAVGRCVKSLIDVGVDKDKILKIEKENVTVDNLPEDVKCVFD